jgi:hypothetical protein
MRPPGPAFGRPDWSAPGAGPESITTSMDSGLVRANARALRNDDYVEIYRLGRTGAENCSVRSRSFMSTTVTIGAVNS